MNEILDFQVLRCGCNSTDFLDIHELRWKPSGGLVIKHTGFQCQRCKKMAVVDTLIRDVRRRRLEQQMEELQSEHANFPIELESVADEQVKGKLPDPAIGGDSVSHVGNAAGKDGLSQAIKT